MNAIQDFMQRYHAVPGNNAGPCWERASTDALMGWAKADLELWVTDSSTHPRLIDRLADIGNELEGRATAMFAKCVAGCPEELIQSWSKVSARCASIWYTIGLQHCRKVSAK